MPDARKDILTTAFDKLLLNSQRQFRICRYHASCIQMILREVATPIKRTNHVAEYAMSSVDA
jgi:hypothetical protein